jgi:hypothetical protein
MEKAAISPIGLDILDQVRLDDIRRFDEKMRKQEMELDKTEAPREQPQSQWDFGLDDGGYDKPSVATKPTTRPTQPTPREDIDEFLKGSGLDEK